MGGLTGHVSCALLFMVRVGILWDTEFSARAIKGAAELSFPGLRGLPAYCTIPVAFLHALLCVYFPFPFMSSLQNRDRSNSIFLWRKVLLSLDFSNFHVSPGLCLPEVAPFKSIKIHLAVLPLAVPFLSQLQTPGIAYIPQRPGLI